MANRKKSEDEATGCACFLAILAIALVVAALISLAALIDPFSWMPPVADVWADCEDKFSTERNECALENRFPGFWWHAVVNLAYSAVAAVLVVVFVGAVSELREKRIARFADPGAAREYRASRTAFLTAGALLAVTAMLPIVVAAA